MYTTYVICTLSRPTTPTPPLPSSTTTSPTTSSSASSTTSTNAKNTFPPQITTPFLHSGQTRKIKILQKAEFETSPATPTLSHTHSPFYDSIEQILTNSETWTLIIIIASIIVTITCIVQIFAMIKYCHTWYKGKKGNPETSIAEPPPFNIRCESKIRRCFFLGN